ncbi:hypothetical protein BKA62DRAFT_42065 [Auriculariales sp. MPI-PUGE-AT-0066]|nr:hypothetical protein BKA62DRAFT_42065 [Auriculariales sp. MPI-PUGE-AT-0066]
MSGSADTSAEELPRISVDSADDWRRVQASFDAALEAAIAAAIGKASNADSVREQLRRWRDATFEAMVPNVRVNGLDLEHAVDESQTVTEPFDEALDRNIWALDAERTAWDKTLSDRRRAAPAEVAAMVQNMLDSASADLTAHDHDGTEQEDDENMTIDNDGSVDESHDAAETHATMRESVLQLTKDIPDLMRRKQLATQASNTIFASKS